MPFHNPYHFVPVKGEVGPAADALSVAAFQAGNVGHVTHDRFVSRTGQGDQPVYSGRLICRLTTEDPVVIGDTRDELADKSHRVHPFELEGKPAVPASTLRGLISSIAEAASNSALRVLEDRPFSYRASMDESLPALGMIVEETDTTGKKQRKLRPIALPLLHWDNSTNRAMIPPEYRAMFSEPLLKVYVDGYRRKSGTQPPVLEIEPGSFLEHTNPDSYSADHQEFWYLRLAGTSALQDFFITTTAPHLSHGWLLGQKAAEGTEPISEAQYQQLPPAQQCLYTRGILRVLGIEGRSDIPTTKKHEIFIPYPSGMETAPTFEVEEALHTFHTLAAERTAVDDALPFHLKGSRRQAQPPSEACQVELRSGDLVFFETDSRGNVSEVAIASIWRRRAGGSSYDYFRQISPEILPFHSQRQYLTLAEQLFGFVEQRQSGQSYDAVAYALASRLRFSFGLLYPQQNDPYEEEVLLKVLDSPKPPSPALYFKARSGQGAYIAKRNLNPRAYTPQGRKFYLHRRGNTGRPWRTLAPGDHLPQKSHVRPMRANLVFYFHIDFENLSQRELGLLCYALRPTAPFRHKIGMGKPLGLGKVRIDPAGLFYVDRQVRYRETSLFESPRYHGSWLPAEESPQAWPDGYAREQQAIGQGTATFPAFDTLRQVFMSTMDKDICRALELLGDPAQVHHAVRTPQVAGVLGAEMEDKTYKWFVANDIRAGNEEPQQDFLQPLSASSPGLPTLLEPHNWND